MASITEEWGSEGCSAQWRQSRLKDLQYGKETRAGQAFLTYIDTKDRPHRGISEQKLWKSGKRKSWSGKRGNACRRVLILTEAWEQRSSGSPSVVSKKERESRSEGEYCCGKVSSTQGWIQTITTFIYSLIDKRAIFAILEAAKNHIFGFKSWVHNITVVQMNILSLLSASKMKL